LEFEGLAAPWPLARGLLPERTEPPGRIGGLDGSDDWDHTGARVAKQIRIPLARRLVGLGRRLMVWNAVWIAAGSIRGLGFP
jgi:hypothetical protein